ncbi:MAG: hypothetical protein U0996_23555 [Planctomycetaceae bacterium]
MADQNQSEGEKLRIERNSLVLDLTQFALDLVGIFDPTPTSDSASMIISLARLDWLGAGMSAVSILPFVGDLAKIGKLPRYERAVSRAITLAAKDTELVARIRPTLQRISRLLDDVPVPELPGELRSLKQKISRFLAEAPLPPGPVSKALQTLPAKARVGFLQAMRLPPIKKPRSLRKRPGPVSEDSLLQELAGKGFVKIKSGSHSAKKLSPRRGAMEDSDIYLRRVIGDDGRHYFESIRIDRKFGGGTSRPFGKTADGLMKSPGARNGRLPGDVQRSDKIFRRIHNTLESTSRKAGVAQGGGRQMGPEQYRRMVNDLQSGSRKGEFSHWHHERFVADPETLAKYLTGPAKGTQKLDNAGQVVLH